MMQPPDTNPAGGGGAGGDTFVAATTSVSNRPQQTSSDRPDATAVEGCGSSAYQRARDLCLAARLYEKWRPPDSEWKILRASWQSPRIADPDAKLFELLLERVAPDRRNADHHYLMAFGSPRKVAAVVRARLLGWLPADVVEDAAIVVGELAFGATVKVKPLGGRRKRHAA